MNEQHAMAASLLPLVLLPGSLCDAGMWEAQVSGLTDVASPVVIELSGFDNIGAMAEHVLASAPADRFALAGFSLGGFVALDVVRRAPERVSHLALLDTAARPDDPGNAPRRMANITAFAEDPYPVLKAFADLTGGPSTPNHVANTVLASMQRYGSRSYAAQQHAMMSRPDARPNLSAITCPTLILCGEEDRATPPREHRAIAEAIPQARYVELPGVGHMTPLEAPDAVTQAMREWLDVTPERTGVER